MDEIQILKRKILLKRQGLALIAAEIKELKFQLALAHMVKHLEQQQCNDFDPLVSRKLECLDFVKNN
jgi:hypothetical protein